MSERTFRVRGLCCGSEVKALKQEVGPRVGGEQNLSFDLLQSRMTVLADPAQATDEQVLEGVRRAGLDAEPWDQPRQADERTGGVWQRHGRAVLTTLSGALLVLAFIVHAALAGSFFDALTSEGGVPLPSVLLYTLSIATGVWYVLPKAWSALRALLAWQHRSAIASILLGNGATSAFGCSMTEGVRTHWHFKPVRCTAAVYPATKRESVCPHVA